MWADLASAEDLLHLGREGRKARLRQLNLKQRWGLSCKPLESLRQRKRGGRTWGQNVGLESQDWTCVFLAVIESRNIKILLTTCYCTALASKSLPHRVWKGEERPLQKCRAQALGPQLSLQGPQLLGQLPAVRSVDLCPEAPKQKFHMIPAESRILKNKGRPWLFASRSQQRCSPVDHKFVSQLDHQGALGRAAHLFLFQEILC